MHKDICVKDFSGTTAPRILKFGIKFGYNDLYGVNQIQHPHVYHSLYFVHFFFFFSNNFFFITDFSGTIAPGILKLGTIY